MLALIFTCALMQAQEPPPVIQPYKPIRISGQRDGFTLQLSIGMGFVHVGSNDFVPSTTELGLGGLNARVGWFFRRDLAVLAEILLFNSSFGAETLFGAAAQYWPTDQLALTGGIAAASVAHMDGGQLSLTFGASYIFWSQPNHAFSAYFDLVPVFSDPTVVVAQWGVAYQFY